MPHTVASGDVVFASGAVASGMYFLGKGGFSYCTAPTVTGSIDGGETLCAPGG